MKRNLHHNDTFVVRFKYAILLMMLITCILSAYFLASVSKKTHRSIVNLINISELSKDVLYMDEVLTMSARLGALTGNEKWEARYLKYVPLLDSAINSIIEHSPSTLMTVEAQATNEANTLLVGMESKAFEHVREGHLDKAQQILFSPEYALQKAIYLRGLTHTSSANRAHIEGKLQNLRNTLFLTNLTLLLLSTIGASATFLYYLRKIRSKKEIAELINTREKEAFISALELAPDALCVLDKSYRVKFANQIFIHSFALNRNDIEGTQIGELSLDLKRLVPESVLNDVMHSNQAHVIEECRSGNEAMVYEIHIFPSEYGLTLVKRDVSQVKEFETVMQRQSAFFHSIIDQIPHPMYWKDSNLVFTGCNQRFLEIVRLKNRTELIGKKNGDFHLLNANFPNSDYVENQVISRECAAEVEERTVLIGGNKKVVLLCNKLPLAEEVGGRMGILAIFSDLTEFKEEEQKRLHLEKELDQMRRFEALDTLSAGIAHELNTPLQYIQENTKFIRECSNGFMTLLDEYDQIFKTSIIEFKDSSKAPFFEAIESAKKKTDIEFLLEEMNPAVEQTLDGIDKLEQIISNLRSLRSDSKTTIKEEDINSIIEYVVKTNSSHWKDNIELHMSLKSGLPPVVCAKSEIGQAFLQVLLNATHAARGGFSKEECNTGEVWVATDLEEEFVLITVTDNGPGISLDIQDRIFDPFFTTRDVGSGTGQGLATAQHFITMRHGGSIKLISRPGYTCFYIRIPVISCRKEREQSTQPTNGRLQ